MLKYPFDYRAISVTVFLHYYVLSRTGHGGPEGSRGVATLSLTSALDEGSC
jgi:hypothetical protein